MPETILRRWTSLFLMGLLLWSGLAGTAVVAQNAGAQQNPQLLSKIAFGSCVRQNKPQPIWDTIAAQDPGLFIFLGDTVYADTTDPKAMAETFGALGRVEPFARFREQVPVLAVWDDHDFGLNDMGSEHPNKAEAQQVFLQFFEEPEDSPRWRREGLHGSWLFGPEGKRVQVILLDTRYHRSPLSMLRFGNWRAYAPQEDPEATMLGAAQWAWLEAQLREPADVRLLVSSIQVLPREHRFEKWANIPAERQRLLDLLSQPHVNSLVLISGDRHHGEISVLPREARDPLVEITASGMNSARRPKNEPNAYREGALVFDDHFGQLTIDWQAESVTITLELINVEGEVKLAKKVALPAR